MRDFEIESRSQVGLVVDLVNVVFVLIREFRQQVPARDQYTAVNNKLPGGANSFTKSQIDNWARALFLYKDLDGVRLDWGDAFPRAHVTQL